MKAPHAHIDNTKGARTQFGQDRQHLKTYRIGKRSIHTRQMHNITGVLNLKPEFNEVKYLKQRVREIKLEEKPAGIDNSKPKTFALSKSLVKKPNNFEI